MKALAHTQPHPLTAFQIRELELPRPTLRPHDLLVEVRAFSVNPVDYKVRSSRAPANEEPIVLGWDFAGVVVEVGPEAAGFKVGDEVYGAGDLLRPGAYAELVAVDARIVARKPSSLSFVQAAALPLTGLTAWEAMIERPELGLGKGASVLIVGGAGGVGSIAIQLLKATTAARVIATASRPETIAWCQRMGADETVDHRNLEESLERKGITRVDAIFSTTHSDLYVKTFAKVLRPFGHVVLIDDPKAFDILPLKRKSIRIHWEFMFTKTLYEHDPRSQGVILEKIAALVDQGRVQSTAQTILKGATVENLRDAHHRLENGQAVGKMVIEREGAQ